MNFKVVLASVKPDYTDRVVDSGKAAGATGATIIPGRGTGIREAKSFFGLTLESQTDIILFLLGDHLVEPVLNAIREAGEFHKPGTGIAFVLPVDQVIGLESQLNAMVSEKK